jgi:hypothetical protein
MFSELVRHALPIGAATAALLTAPSLAHAQAAGSAEATAAVRTGRDWQPPMTPWGHPDLQGIWTTDDMRGIPQQRAAEFGTRQYLTDEEFAARGEQREGARETQDRGAVGTFRNEEGTRTFGYTSMVIDPPDGRFPPVLPEARERRQAGTFGVGPFNTMQDFSLYDRCITRGVVGSFGPAVYGNGARILQTPDAVVISYEMVHDTRIIPLDGRPHVGANIRLWNGDARGRWEGNTLVVETTNFNDKGVLGTSAATGRIRGIPHSEEMRVVERFTRISEDVINYSATVTDPKVYTAPWTVALPLNRDPTYKIFEYACHEGNLAMPNALSAGRARERAAASRGQQ